MGLAFKFGTMASTLIDGGDGLRVDAAGSMPSADEIVDNVYKQTKHTFGNRVTAASALNLIVTVMETCERLVDMSGPGRKRVAVEVVDRFLADIPEDTENRQLIIASVNLLLPTIIDSVASVAKGQTNMSKKVKKAFGWLACC